MLIFHAFKQDTVDIEKTDIICLLTLVVDKISGLYLHLSLFVMKYSRSA